MTLSRREFVQASAAGALLVAGGMPLAARAQDPLANRQLRALRSAVRGRVFAPGNPGYNGARLVYNERFDGIRPPAVVQVRDVADVQAVVRWADRFDVPLVARAGGHAYNGASTSRSAVVVDTGGLDRVSVDGTAVTAGPGTRNIDLYVAAARRGLALPSGSCPGVAVGGLSTGGGMGLAGRGLGMMVDRVTAYDVVTASGARRTVSARQDPDLFWALRGGGGSFALVTGVHLRARRLSRAAWFFITYPASARAEVLSAWDDLVPGAPSALTSICTLTSTGATAFGQYLGSESALRRLVAPLSRISGARFSAGTDSFLALQRRWAGCSEGESIAACRSDPRSTFDASSVYFAEPLSGSALRAFVSAADGGASLLCDSYGGRINDVAPGATAFVHRTARFSVQIVSYAPIGTARARVRGARAKVAPFGNGQAYQNYADLNLRNPLRAYYGSNLARLRTVKAAADPDGRFAPVQGITA